MSGPSGSRLPSTSAASEGERTPATHGGRELKQPRKVFRPENGKQFTSEPGTDFRPTSTSVYDKSSASVSKDQKGPKTQSSEQPGISDNGEHVLPVFGTPETIHYTLEPDATSTTTGSGTIQTGHTVTVSTITTKVEDQRSAGTQKTGQSTTAKEVIVQPRRDSSALSSQTTTIRRGYEKRTSVPDGAPTRSSTYSEIHHMEPPGSTSRSAWDALHEIEDLHRRKVDGIFVVAEDDRQRIRMENERLLQENAALVSRITLLEIQVTSGGSDAGYDNMDPNITTITTTITTVTTTITAVTTRVEQWKHTGAMKAGQVTISRKELELLLSDMSKASSQMVDLQRYHAELSKSFNSLRRELQVVLSLRDEKESTITSLMDEIVQYKDGASKAQQIIEEMDHKISSLNAEVAQSKQSKVEQSAMMRQAYEELQTNFSTTSSQKMELQKQYDAQFKELSSVRSELQDKKSLVEGKERIISTLTAEVEQWKHAYTTKEEQITVERRDKEKLQQELAALSSRAGELQKRYDAQSQDIVSIRKELQTKVSLLEENEHTISILGTKVTQAERENSVKTEQIATARKDVEQLRRELSSASSRVAELQERLEVRSKELNTARDELHKIEAMYPDITPGKSPVSQRIEEKNKQMEELRRDLAAANARSTKLQRSNEAMSREVTALRDELREKTSQNEGTINTLTAQFDQLRGVDAKKAEQITTLFEQVDRLKTELFTSTSQLTELQARYDSQSREFISVRNELQAMTLSDVEKARAVASLTAEVNQWKNVNGGKEEQIATISARVEELQQALSASASSLAELQGRHDAQSRELISVRNDVKAKVSLLEGKEHTIASLGAERDQWKVADSTKAEQIATITREFEKLQRDLSTSASQLAELQGRYKAQSTDLASVRTELQSRTSSYEEKVRTTDTLTAQIKEWSHKDASKEERILTVRKEVEDLRRKLISSETEITQLQQRYGIQSEELHTLHEQLKSKETGNNRAVSTLTSQLETWKRSDAAKAEQLRTAHENIDQLRRDLATSSSQIENWKHSDVSRTKELADVQKELKQLRHDLSTSSSQITEHQGHLAAELERSKELSLQIGQWERTDAARVGELDAARKKAGQLQNELSASSSRITEFQQRFDSQSTELDTLHEQLQASSLLASGKDNTITTLNDQVEQWRRVAAAKAEELGRAGRDIERLQRELATLTIQLQEPRGPPTGEPEAPKRASQVSTESKNIYEKITTEGKDYSAIFKLTTTIDQWLHTDAKRAEDLNLELTRRNKENEELRRHLITLKEIYVRAPELKEIFQSETIEIQRHYEEKSKELKSALAERQSQLDGVQRFVTTADTYADTMIIQMLQKLNAEVQQTTTFMAESIVEDFRPRTAKLTSEQLSVVKRVSECVGQTLTDCLGKNDRDELELFLPIAFQAYVTYYLRLLISSWTTKKEFNDLINETYERLQKSEAQTISGRWRSLTRTYISPACMSNPKPLVSITVSGLSAIVVAAGCALTLSDAESKISSKFGESVSSIISIAAQFGNMIGEVVSADFEVLTARPSETFEGSTMEDVNGYDNGGGKPGRTTRNLKVLCSTQLGMSKRMQLESGKSNTLPVMKAKVILESFLDD